MGYKKYFENSCYFEHAYMDVQKYPSKMWFWKGKALIGNVEYHPNYPAGKPVSLF